MTEGSEDLEVGNLVLSVRSSFPKEAQETDRKLVRRGYEAADFAEILDIWVECFADRTTDAVRKRDSSTVDAHTRFFAQQYLHGSDRIKQFVDVSYAEPLLWNATIEDKVWAWQYIAGPIRKLYEEMWGEPRC